MTAITLEYIMKFSTTHKNVKYLTEHDSLQLPVWITGEPYGETIVLLIEQHTPKLYSGVYFKKGKVEFKLTCGDNIITATCLKNVVINSKVNTKWSLYKEPIMLENDLW